MVMEPSVELEIKSLRELLETRMDANDEAVRLLQAYANRSPTIGEVVSEFGEKFRGIDERFKERDFSLQKYKANTKKMLETCALAQKETANKTEAGFTKQLDGIASLVTATTNALSEKNDDLKQRLVLI